MSVWTQPSPSDFDRWESWLAAGEDPAEAARLAGEQVGRSDFTSSAFRRADPERHAAALRMGRAVRSGQAVGAEAPVPVRRGGRETIATKAARLLTAGRLTVEYADSAGTVRASCRGDRGTYLVTLTAAGASCSCPARVRPCAHLTALLRVVKVPSSEGDVQ